METLENCESYRCILRQIIEKHAGLMARRSPGVDVLPLCNREYDSYMILRVGWDMTGRVHYIMLHLRLRNEGKICIEFDGIEYGIQHDLLEAGIPESDICFAENEPQSESLPQLLAA